MRSNETLRTLEAGDPAVGVWITSNSPRAAEALAREVDWIWIDAEHTPVTSSEAEELIRGVELGGATPVVRTSSVGDAVDGGAKRALDSGAQGLIVPQVETAEDARRAARAAYLPPAGGRGVSGSSRANRYGGGFDEYVARANGETMLVVQLETPAAADNVDGILAVEGIDAAIVGENDLAAAHGHPGEKGREEVRADVEAIRETALSAGVHLGCAARTPERRADRLDRGFRLFMIGTDIALARRGIEASLGR